MIAQHLVVEVDTGSLSSLGRPPNRTWLVRLCSLDRSVVIAIGLSRTAADHLAAHISELINPDPPDRPPLVDSDPPDEPPSNRHHP